MDGQLSREYGNSDRIPNEECPLPQKDISKIDFHMGKHAKKMYRGCDFPGYLGGLIIHFDDGTT